MDQSIRLLAKPANAWRGQYGILVMARRKGTEDFKRGMTFRDMEHYSDWVKRHGIPKQSRQTSSERKRKERKCKKRTPLFSP